MKNIIHIIYILLGIVFIICFEQCKKDGPQSNIKLTDKPLSVIQTNIKGKWTLQYEKGGICGTCIFYQKDFFWEFGNYDKVLETYKGTVIVDTKINWVRERDVFTDLTYIMTFSDKQNVPWNYIVDGIYNDTLVLYDNSSDRVFYHFTKSN